MKRSNIKSGLLALLFLGSFSSFFFLNSPAVRQNTKSPIEQAIQQAQAEKEPQELVLPDVTVIQKAIDLLKLLMYR